MTAASILTDVSIVTGVMVVVRSVRNATREWDGIKNSIVRLNESIDRLVVAKEKDHKLIDKRLERLEDYAVRNRRAGGQMRGEERGNGKGGGHT